jgi:lactate dehydrogenase-like 2-hydroxyacid dehydrogenase
MSVHKPVLVVTTHFPDKIEARIDRDYDARRSPHERPFTHDELIEASSGADALFITPFERLDADFFKRLPDSVKVIATYSVGIDHIDLQAAANRNIAIAYTPGINADATADIAMLLMLGASRRAYEGQEGVAVDRKDSRHCWYGTSGSGCCSTCEGLRHEYPLRQSDPPARGVGERRRISLLYGGHTSGQRVSFLACA